MIHVSNAAAAGLEFKKSSYSGNNVDCVEFATPGEAVSCVRDSKDPGGPALVLTAGARAAFITAVAAGEFGFGLV
ncbi:DUF397 domain-containing protein [Kitasatospora sp. NPDC088351]|uniref:DUF397 domain-containing protein n=1 Tax=Kitasatospora sp. NPDC088351 TaxID=3155180 RepID=UPI003444D9C4